MNDDDIKIFIPEEKFLQIGSRRFKIWISSERALIATDMFNKLTVKGTDERKSIATDLDFYKSMIEIALILIQQDFIPVMKKHFSIKTVISWIQRERLTSDYILKNMEIKELSEFIDNALEPIIGTKKKVMEQENTMIEISMALIKEMGLEAFTKLLGSSLQPVDTKKVM